MQIVSFLSDTEFLFKIWIYGTLGFYYYAKTAGIFSVKQSNS